PPVPPVPHPPFADSAPADSLADSARRSSTAHRHRPPPPPPACAPPGPRTAHECRYPGDRGSGWHSTRPAVGAARPPTTGATRRGAARDGPQSPPAGAASERPSGELSWRRTSRCCTPAGLGGPAVPPTDQISDQISLFLF